MVGVTGFGLVVAPMLALHLAGEAKRRAEAEPGTYATGVARAARVLGVAGLVVGVVAVVLVVR